MRQIRKSENKYQKMYNNIHQDGKKLARKDKRNYIDMIAEEDEVAAGKLQQ